MQIDSAGGPSNTLFARYSHLSGCRRSTLAPSLRFFCGLQARTHSSFIFILICCSPALSRRRRQPVAVIPSHYFTRTRTCKKTKAHNSSRTFGNTIELLWCLRAELNHPHHNIYTSELNRTPRPASRRNTRLGRRTRIDGITLENRVNYMPRRRRDSQYSGYMLRFTQEHACQRVSTKLLDMPEDGP